MKLLRNVVFAAALAGGLSGCLWGDLSSPEPIGEAVSPDGLKPPMGIERYTSPVIWMALYYQDPDPGRFPVVLKQLEDQGFLSAANAQDYVTAFLITLLRENPSSNEFSLIKNLSEADYFDQDAEGVISSAFWLMGNAEGVAALKTMVRRNPSFGRFLGITPPSIEVDEIIDEPGLNIVWGCFHATGDLRHLRKIVNCLDEDRYRKGQNVVKKKVNQLAVYMLADNCYTDPLVLAYCKKALEDCPAAVQYDLERVVNIAEMRRQKAEDDALAARVLGQQKKTDGDASAKTKLLPVSEHVKEIGMETSRPLTKPPAWRRNSVK